MNYRQWKKKYKKQYGHNPPITIDKRKQRKYAKQVVSCINNIDWVKIGLQIRDAITGAFTTIREAFVNIGNELKNYANIGLENVIYTERLGVTIVKMMLLIWQYNHLKCRTN